MFFLAAGWGIIVLLGLVGWGQLLARFLRPGKSLGLGLNGAIGFGASTVVGGVLGLAHLILPGVVIGFIVIGAVIGIAGLIKQLELRQIRRLALWDWVLVSLLVCFSASRYLASVRTLGFQPYDDLPGYVVFPVKMLQTGNFAPDPYSDRRLSGLGGQPWSQTLVLAALDVPTINLFDHGVAFLLLLALTGSWLLSIGMGLRPTLGILLTLTLISPRYLNVASFLSISLLLLALFVLLTSTVASVREAILLAILAAGCMSLKQTCILFTGAILSLYFIWEFVRTRSGRPLFFGAGVGLVTIVFLVPWMQSSYNSGHTLLFPFLGRGTSQLPELSGSIPRHIIFMLLALSVAPLLAVIPMLACSSSQPRHRTWCRTGIIFFIAVALIVFVVGLKTGGAGWMRYSQPLICGLLPVPLAALWLWTDASQTWRAAGRALSIIIWLGLVCLSFAWEKPNGPISALNSQMISIRQGLAWAPLVTPGDRSYIASLQSTIPPNSTILTHLDDPHLLNFKRNNVLIADHPGLAGPAPGIPLPPEPASLRAYLLANGVRYVAVTYQHTNGYSSESEFDPNSPYLWDRLCHDRALAFQRAVVALSKSRRVLYDDGLHLAIDLK